MAVLHANISKTLALQRKKLWEPLACFDESDENLFGDLSIDEPQRDQKEAWVQVQSGEEGATLFSSHFVNLQTLTLSAKILKLSDNILS